MGSQLVGQLYSLVNAAVPRTVSSIGWESSSTVVGRRSLISIEHVTALGYLISSDSLLKKDIS